jgi:hypothetical protein
MAQKSKKGMITGLQTMGQIPLMECYRPSLGQCLWRIWLSYSPNRDQGTYLILHSNGAIWRETIFPDGGVSTVVITPEQKV